MCLKPIFQQHFRSVRGSCFPKFAAMDGSNVNFPLETTFGLLMVTMIMLLVISSFCIGFVSNVHIHIHET